MSKKGDGEDAGQDDSSDNQDSSDNSDGGNKDNNRDNNNQGNNDQSNNDPSNDGNNQPSNDQPSNDNQGGDFSWADEQTYEDNGRTIQKFTDHDGTNYYQDAGPWQPSQSSQDDSGGFQRSDSSSRDSSGLDPDILDLHRFYDPHEITDYRDDPVRQGWQQGRASDGSTFDSLDDSTRGMFQATHGEDAPSRWAEARSRDILSQLQQGGGFRQPAAQPDTQPVVQPAFRPAAPVSDEQANALAAEAPPPTPAPLPAFRPQAPVSDAEAATAIANAPTPVLDPRDAGVVPPPPPPLAAAPQILDPRDAGGVPPTPPPSVDDRLRAVAGLAPPTQVLDPRDAGVVAPTPPSAPTAPVTPVTPPAAAPASGAQQIAANSAATAMAAQGGTPQQVAQAAVEAALSFDRRSLAGEAPATKAAFGAAYGDQAGAQWAQQHNEELKRNIALYGTPEPKARTAAVAGAPAGTPVAPDRTIGRAAAPVAPVAAPTASRAVPAAPATSPVAAAPAPPPASAAAATAPPATAAPASPYRTSDPRDAGVAPPTPPPGSVAPSVSDPRDANVLPPSPPPGDAPTTAPTTPESQASFLQADREQVPPLQAGLGKFVNADPITIATNAVLPQSAQFNGQVNTLIENQLAGAIARSDQSDDTMLDAVAKVAWYRETVGKQGPPEAAPAGYISAWKDTWHSGGTAPLTEALDASLTQRGLERTPVFNPADRLQAPNGAPSDVFSPSPRLQAPNGVATTDGTSTARMSTTAPVEDGWTIDNRVRAFAGVPGADTGDGGAAIPARPSEIFSPSSRLTAPRGVVNDVGGEATSGTGSAPALPRDALARPFDFVVGEAARQQGAADPRGFASSVAGGIAKGEAWAQPYADNLAKLAWYREYGQPSTQTPGDAPADYIRSWKDALKGGDVSVPLVAEVNQKMIDYGATRTVPGGAFNWQATYGPTGENGLISRQVASNDCGPNAFSNILRSQGYNADPSATFSFAKEMRYHNGDQFTGPENFANMLRKEAGLDAKATPIDWNTIDKELSEGRLVTLSGPGHYWTISAKDAGGRYYAGQTAIVTSNAGPDGWVPGRGGFNFRGAADTMITYSGAVDPNSRAVSRMGLQPPAVTAPSPSAPRMATMSVDAARPADTSGGSELDPAVPAPGGKRTLPSGAAYEEQVLPAATKAAQATGLPPDRLAGGDHRHSREHAEPCVPPPRRPAGTGASRTPNPAAASRAGSTRHDRIRRTAQAPPPR